MKRLLEPQNSQTECVTLQTLAYESELASDAYHAEYPCLYH